MNQRNPAPGTPRKGGRPDRPAGKLTICHATGSETNPYVRITVSRNAEKAHSGHSPGGRKDIIPAPEGGCPGGAATAHAAGSEVSRVAGVLAAGTAGGNAGARPAAPGIGAVAGVEESRGESPVGNAAAAGKRTTSGSLPFTGLQLLLVLAVGSAAIGLGLALRRALAHRA